MVVGESGLGKTTFLQTLLGKYVAVTDPTPRQSINEKTNHISQIGTLELTSEIGDQIVRSAIKYLFDRELLAMTSYLGNCNLRQSGLWRLYQQPRMR